LKEDDKRRRKLSPKYRSLLESDLALFLTALGRHDEAAAIYRDQLELWADHRDETCQLLANISEVEFMRGNLPAAIDAGRQGMQATSVRSKLYFAACNLGIACIYGGLLEEGMKAFIECRQTLPNPTDHLWASAGRKLHLSLLRMGRIEELEQLLPDTYNYNRSQGFSKEIAYTDIIRAEVLRQQSEFGDALEALERGENWARPRSCLEVIGLAQLFRANLLRDTGEIDDARSAAEAGFGDTKAYPLLQADFLNLMARMALDAGDKEAARKDASNSLKISESKDHKYFWGTQEANDILQRL
jgi:tetratricopeptide (TPR) repeat protein